MPPSMLPANWNKFTQEYLQELAEYLSFSEELKSCPSWPYSSVEDHTTKTLKASTVFRECSLVKILSELNSAVVVGTNITFTVMPKNFKLRDGDDDAATTKKYQDSVNCYVENNLCLQESIDEASRRYDRDGTLMLIRDKGDEDEQANFTPEGEAEGFFKEQLGWSFVDVQNMSKPPGIQCPDWAVSKLWDYGVVADKRFPKQHIGRWVEGYFDTDLDKRPGLKGIKGKNDTHGFIPCSEYLLFTRSADKGAPFGDVCLASIYEQCCRLESLDNQLFQFITLQLATAVVREYEDALDDDLVKELAMRLGATPKDKKGRASSQMMDAKGFTVKHLEVQSVDEVLKLINHVTQKVSMIFGWPGWVATGSLEEINQHSLSHSTRISQHNAQKRRQILAKISAVHIACHLGEAFDFSRQEEEDFLKDYVVIPHFPTISFETLAQIVNSVCKLTANRLISRAQGRRDMSVNCDLMEMEIEAEQGEFGTGLGNSDVVGDDRDLPFGDNFDTEGQSANGDIPANPRDQETNPSPTGAETSSGSVRSQ